MRELRPYPVFQALLIGLGGRLLVGLLQLEVFLVGVALLAGLALFMSGHAALVRALFAFDGSLFTASLLLPGFVGGSGGAGQQREDAPQNYQCLYQLHNLQGSARATADLAGGGASNGLRANLLFRRILRAGNSCRNAQCH